MPRKASSSEKAEYFIKPLPGKLDGPSGAQSPMTPEFKPDSSMGRLGRFRATRIADFTARQGRLEPGFTTSRAGADVASSARGWRACKRVCSQVLCASLKVSTRLEGLEGPGSLARWKPCASTGMTGPLAFEPYLSRMVRGTIRRSGMGRALSHRASAMDGIPPLVPAHDRCAGRERR